MTTPRLSMPEMDSGMEDIKKKIDDLKASIKFTPRALDPNLTANIETDVKGATAANPTDEDHRFTVVVPNPDDTVFSLGKAGPPERIADVGITGRTKSHVHFETREKAKTVLSLGLPPQSTVLTHATVLGGVLAKLGHVMEPEGFSVVTEEHTWIRSKDSLDLASQNSRASLQSANAETLIRSQETFVSVEGKKAVNIAAGGSVRIGAKAEIASYISGFESGVGKVMTNNFTQTIVKLADIARARYQIYQSAKNIEQRAADGESGWSKTDAWDKAKFRTDAIKFSSSVGRYLSGLGSDEGGKVSISAETYASLTGDVGASVWGGASATLSSALSASVLGGTSSVIGLGWASVWSSIGTSIRSLRDAGIEGENGRCTVRGMTEVRVESTAGPLKLQGSSEVRLSSTDDRVYICGNSGVSLAGGAKGSDGYAINVAHSGVEIGVTKSPASFGSSHYIETDTCFLVLDRAGFVVDNNGPSIKVESEEITIGVPGTTLKVTANEASINSGKIHFG